MKDARTFTNHLTQYPAFLRVAFLPKFNIIQLQPQNFLRSRLEVLTLLRV